MKNMILLVLLLFGLGLPAGSAWCAEAAIPQVVVSIKPIHALVASVMQGVAEPQLLVKGGGSPHGYVLRPSEAQALARADLIVWVGHSLESFLEKPLSTLGRNARQLTLLDALESQLLPARVGGSWDVHAHQEEPGHEDATGEQHGHAEQELNPHLWLSPQLAQQIVAQVAAALSAVDPSRQAVYRQNAEQLQQRLADLHRELKNRLAPVKEVPYVVFHDAYQYFETAYELRAVGSITIDPERKPGIKRLLEMREKIKRLNARCVFSEPQFEPRLVATIIEGTGARTGELDPIGAELTAGPESYFQLLNALAADLIKGLR